MNMVIKMSKQCYNSVKPILMAFKTPKLISYDNRKEIILFSRKKLIKSLQHKTCKHYMQEKENVTCQVIPSKKRKQLHAGKKVTL